MTNEEALKINGSLAHCYLFREGIIGRLRREHLERVSRNTTLRLLSAAETVQAVDPETVTELVQTVFRENKQEFQVLVETFDTTPKEQEKHK